MTRTSTPADAGTSLGSGDPFHDPVLRGIGLLFVFVGLAILALTCLVIWGVQYDVPGWNANSFPPPLVH